MSATFDTTGEETPTGGETPPLRRRDDVRQNAGDGLARISAPIPSRFFMCGKGFLRCSEKGLSKYEGISGNKTFEVAEPAPYN